MRQNPGTKNALLGSFDGELDLSAIVQLVVDLANKARPQEGAPAKPTIPLLVVTNIKVLF